MSLVLYTTEDGAAEKELRIFKDPSFEQTLNLHPSDRYAYTLQYFTPKVTRSSWPAQTQKLMDYNKANNLNMFEAEKGFVIASQVFMTTGVKVKRCYSNIPFSPEVWAALSDPVNLQLLEEKIKDWNLQTDAKLKETSPGAKLDLEETIGHIPTLDDRVQVGLVLDRFDSNTFGVKTDADPTRLMLIYKFDKDHIAAAQGAEHDGYDKSIHQFARVIFPAAKFFEWQKNFGTQFMEVIYNAHRTIEEKRCNEEAEDANAKKQKLQ